MDKKALCKTYLEILILGLALLFSPSSWAGSFNVVEAANKAAIDVGKVRKTEANGKKGPVFVFEEVHTSRIGQIQIAIMLVRLHEQIGLKTIGLEGALWSGKILDGRWFHNAGGATAKSFREDVAVRMLAEGEISAAEFMTLVFADIETYGVELKDEYDVKLQLKTSPEMRYLLAIAKTTLTPADLRHIANLQAPEALEYLLTLDPWISQQYQAIKDPSQASPETLVTRIRALQKKATDLGVMIPPNVREDMNNELKFFETADKRSRTMVDNTLRVPAVAAGKAVALNIGAGHAEKVLQLLRSQGTSFAELAPLSLFSNYGMQSSEQFQRKDERTWARNTRGTLGYLLNNQRKPPPIIETATAHSYASLNLAVLLVAEAARKNATVPDAVWNEISTLPELRVDRNSFRKDGTDIIFRAWLIDTKSKEKEVWARVGVASAGPAKTLEDKLLRAAAGLGGDGKIPPKDPAVAEDLGPGDEMRDGTIINRVDEETLASYADSLDNAQKMGRISG